MDALIYIQKLRKLCDLLLDQHFHLQMEDMAQTRDSIRKVLGDWQKSNPSPIQTKKEYKALRKEMIPILHTFMYLRQTGLLDQIEKIKKDMRRGVYRNKA